jgi:sugar phosphate isomerase/epimerase
MSDIRLGINTGFALNRFPEPEEWIRIVSEELGLHVVQFTADLLNPSLPDPIVQKQIDKIRSLCSKYGVSIEHTFTSAFTRVNHFSHPDPQIREYWVEWFSRFVDISVQLGAESVGSHLGILSVHDLQHANRRELIFQETVKNWRRIAIYAKKKGVKYLSWEPMSIAREYGETLAEAHRIQKALNEDIALPMKVCLDVDHGDVLSSDPRDTDPYVWIQEFGSEAPLIQLKQSTKDKSAHWAFTKDKNVDGKINPDRLMETLQKYAVPNVLLLLELSFREREPVESRVLQDLKNSVDFWRPFVRT